MKTDSPVRSGFGLLSGLAFGALLQRGRVSRYDVIVGQLQRRDWTVAKVMGTAIAVGATGLHALESEGRGELEPKPLQLGGLIGGGMLFGAGLALLGYCPGTTLAAIGEGRRDAVAGAIGMLAGAALFVRLFPAIKPLVTAGDYGKPRLSESTKTPAWLWVGALNSGLALALLAEARPHRSRWSLMP
jgi:uncharacterized protein